MDPITSAELDSPSKTPLFLGIAALLLAGTGLVLAWMGFSKANALEAQLAEMTSSAEALAAVEEEVAGNSAQVDQVVSGVGTLRSEVNQILQTVQSDIQSVKKNVRSNAIQAGTAMKKVQELEAKGVKVAAAPKPAPVRTSKAATATKTTSKTSTATKMAAAVPAGLKEYTIKSGDNFSKLATRFKVSLNAILKANPGVNPGGLQIGQKVLIPVAQ